MSLEEEDCKVEMPVDIEHNKYPYSIVWTALPCITCCFPCIGHTGICQSDGTINDFVGGKYIHKQTLAFGDPLKYLVLDHDNYSAEQWDDAISRANQKFKGQTHNLITNNCHHHVAEALNELNYQDKRDWSQVDIAFLVLKAKHAKWTAYLLYLIFALLLIFLLK